MKQVTFTKEELGHQSHHAGAYDVVREWSDNWQGVEVRNYRAIREGCSKTATTPQLDRYKLFTRYPNGSVGVRYAS
jgi:hypothetical protein